MTDYLFADVKLAAREYGWTRLSKETGIDRVWLYKVLSPGHSPTLKTIQRICKVLGFRVVVVRSDKWNETSSTKP